MTESMEIPPELFARLAHPTVRLSVLEGPGSIVVELFSSGGAVEVEEVRILRQAHGRDMWFLSKSLVVSAAVTIMASLAILLSSRS